MLSHIARRLLAALPVMAFVALFVFGLLYLAPGDPAAIMAGDQATAADIARIRIALKLDDPFPIRFGNWVWSLLHGDLGLSLFTNQPVAAMIVQRLEPTYLLMLMTLVVSVTLALPIGVIAAWKHNTASDRAVMVFAVLSFSVPSFVVGYLLAFVFGLQLRWLPVQGYVPMSNGLWPAVRSLILPAVALGSVYIGLLARITRATMLEVLAQDYVRTARAKGAEERKILFKHALKNCSVPIITTIGSGVALLIGGAIVTETVFAIPGLGRLTVDAILRRDYPVIQGVILLFSFMYVLVNLLVDMLYTVFDPRIRY
ncbi:MULTISPECIES: ABC transporter permease [Bosea]|jgi:peptide/nickel transport system permease protein|uniref:ABC transporter permease n=1 Tax=Bosea TaxID=85413 RepID=UPI00214FDFE7|nr:MULTISPECIES: ABC transporter permease [Bosea]MCR4521585.1 ABC transporter permease [Bosea sp. 47.2.35]MDR6829330.1 peptide/nickel transport system permease protein [Bosea robiniae]MDR6896155.1 peptide/nickel transport system permease protein [Bosea sp. BE109]MDR7139611.1 peptide/nickel transport system permease protein [Bosea sp. BE168]MDR7176250.1 peptide/nickel transport system permease protein [Bosea sp. BE271]